MTDLVVPHQAHTEVFIRWPVLDFEHAGLPCIDLSAVHVVLEEGLLSHEQRGEPLAVQHLDVHKR